LTGGLITEDRPMEHTEDSYVQLLQSGARRLTGHQRRLFQAEVCLKLCDGNAREAERRFGWGRRNVATGIHEHRSGMRCMENFRARGRRRAEDLNPRLAEDIRDVVGPRSHADPELKSSRRYSNLSAGEVREALLARGHREQDLPGERAMRDVLNRMNFRLRRVRKGKPLRKTKDADAIFANVRSAREQSRGDPRTLEISMDAKAKVKVGDYVQGGKMPVR
jgi:Rhodopirellula transposase DDE domain